MTKLWMSTNVGSSQKCECTFTMKAHEKAVTAGCWLPDRVVVTGSEDSSIVLWELVKRSNVYR